MTKSESKYFATAQKMDEAFLELLYHKDFEYITVKELCKKAGVNRSTFYLHYETLDDLLSETAEYINRRFLSYFQNDVSEPQTEKDGYFLTPTYLKPYLNFVKENKRLFQTGLKRHRLLGQDDFYEQWFQNVFTPVMDKYRIPNMERKYMVAFYIEGITAIVKQWLKGDCVDDIDDIVRIIVGCVKSPHDKRK